MAAARIIKSVNILEYGPFGLPSRFSMVSPNQRRLDIFDDLLARAFACSICLSHLPLLSGYDEPRTLSYQIPLFGPQVLTSDTVVVIPFAVHRYFEAVL